MKTTLILITAFQLIAVQVVCDELEICTEARFLLKEVNLQVNLALQPYWPQLLKLPDQAKVDADETVRLSLIKIRDFAKTLYNRVDNLRDSSHNPDSKCFDNRKEEMEFIVRVLSVEIKDCVDYHRPEIAIMKKALDNINFYVRLNDTYSYSMGWGLQTFCHNAVLEFNIYIDRLPGMMKKYVNLLTEKGRSLKELFEACGRDRSVLMAQESDFVLDMIQECLRDDSHGVYKWTTVSTAITP